MLPFPTEERTDSRPRSEISGPAVVGSILGISMFVWFQSLIFTAMAMLAAGNFGLEEYGFIDLLPASVALWHFGSWVLK
jgi:hypothetical protein